MRRLPGAILQFSTPVVLAIVFASVYLAVGPGCFFSVDEVVVEEMAQAVYQRGTLEVAAMNTAIPGRGGAYYAHRGPVLGYVSIPFVALGNILDNRIGSISGGTAPGSALGTLEHPLRWGGRFSIFAALITNAIVGGLVVAMLYLIAVRMGVTHGVAIAFACAAGAATLLASESTHYFQHPLEAFTLLCGFWFLSNRNAATLSQDAYCGGLSLGLALLARPNTAPAAAVIWLYGILVARMKTPRADDRAWLSAAAKSAAAPAACIVLYLFYDSVQYGSIFKSGYGDENGIFHLTLAGPIQAFFAYLASPSLSVFLFAPLLLFIPVVLKQSLRRWPLEAKCLLLAAMAHVLLIAFLPVWDGAIAYGPRYLLAPMLLLMPLTLPAFEKAFGARIRPWRTTMAGLILLGVLVQVIGISVYVATNEWYYNAHNIYLDRSFVFIPSASPILVQLRDLIAGRNVIPWAARAVSRPGPELAFLAALILLTAGGLWFLRAPRVTPAQSSLPRISILTMGSAVLLGFFATAPIVAPVETRIVSYINAGLAAQQAGHDVKAEELYALVLSLDPRNKFALHNLALLYEKAGKPTEAVELYQRALISDPSFAPSLQNVSRYAVRLKSIPPGDCASANECFAAGKRLWDLNDKAAALAIWDKGAQRFPTEPSLVRSVARSQYDLGDYKAAEKNYRQAAALSPADNEIRTDLAWALLATSAFQEARQICNEVLARDGSNAAAKAILARLPNR